MNKRRIKLKSTPRVREYNRALRRGSKIKHVVKHENGWAVKRSGAKRASGVFETQDVAVKSALKMAKNSGTSVVVHRGDGRIRDVLNRR